MLAGIPLIVGVLVAVGVLTAAHPASEDETERGDWTRQPAELFTASGRVVAADESRWMIATQAGDGYRYRVHDEAGRSVGDDFVAGFDACARTRSGALGCQIGNDFFVIDLTTGTREKRTAVPTTPTARGPIPLADAWIVGGYGNDRIISETGAEKWRIPADENVVQDVTRVKTWAEKASLVVTYQPTTDRRRVRDADTGKSLVDCACVITALADGFATEATDGATTLYGVDGRKSVSLDRGERVIGGGRETLIAVSEPNADAGPSPYRVRTADGRSLWEGISTNGPPRACGDWLLAADGVVSIRDGEQFTSAKASWSGYDCLGAGKEWIVMPDQVIVPRGRGWQPASGTLGFVDGLLVNAVGEVVAVYSPTKPAPAPIPELVVAPDFSTPLTFTPRQKSEIAQRMEIARVSYDPATTRWWIEADAVEQQGKSTVRYPARERYVLSDRGEVVAKEPAGAADTVTGCGPYSVGLDEDDPARIVIRRSDGGDVGIGPQPDPDHIIAAGAECVGYSADHLALAPKEQGKGIVLIPLHDNARAVRLPKASGFASGRPYAIDGATTITVFPAVP